MSITELYRCARSLEAMENYACASIQISDEIINDDKPLLTAGDFVRDDKYFWSKVLSDPQKAWGQRFQFDNAALSTWVARVPGLFWSEGAKALRKITVDAIEYKSDDWLVLRPQGKSQQVLGGIGTLKFPPDENGYRLVTLSCGHNASSGVPMLVSPEVWKQHKLDDGSILGLWAKWQPMPSVWAERFPSIKGIPKGYLVINHQTHVYSASAMHAPTQFHPCTVMEYYQGDAKLYDFVYATADTGVRNHRRYIETFFGEYKKARGRFGKYLMSADISDPLWEAEYDSPIALQRAEPGAKSQLELLRMRVQGESFKGNNLDLIAQFLAREYDNVGLRRISEIIGIPSAHWFTGSAVADSCVQLLHMCVDRGKVEELLDAVAVEHPQAFL